MHLLWKSSWQEGLTQTQLVSGRLWIVTCLAHILVLVGSPENVSDAAGGRV